MLRAERSPPAAPPPSPPPPPAPPARRAPCLRRGASRAAAPAAASDVLRRVLSAGVGEATVFSYSCMETAPNETRLCPTDLRGTLRFGVFSFSPVALFIVPSGAGGGEESNRLSALQREQAGGEISGKTGKGIRGESGDQGGPGAA